MNSRLGCASLVLALVAVSLFPGAGSTASAASTQPDIDAVANSSGTGFAAIPGFYPVRERYNSVDGTGGWDVELDPETGLLWTVASDANVVTGIDASGHGVKSFGGFGTSAGDLNSPRALTINGDEIFVADTGNHRVQVFDRVSGNYLRSIGEESPDGLTFPCGVAVAGGRAYVVDAGRETIVVFRLNGTFIREIGSAGSGDGELFTGCGSVGIAVREGEVFVSDVFNDRVTVFAVDGTWRRHIGPGEFTSPFDLQFDVHGMLWVVDAVQNRVTRWSSSGVAMGSLGSPGAGLGEFDAAVGLALDPTGQTLWVTNVGGDDRIQEFTSLTCSGQQLTHAGTSGPDRFSFPTDSLAVVVHTGSGDDEITTGDGDDIVCSGRGADVVRTGSGDDEIYGGLGNDQIVGGVGDNTIFGQGGDDVLNGGSGADKIFGQGGVDSIRGGPGDDVLRGRSAR